MSRELRWSSLGRSFTIEIDDQSAIGDARRKALGIAESLGFDEQRAGELAIVVTECATNIVRHAGHGRIDIRSAENDVIEVVAVDSGPGMADIERCLTDGFSTGGTAGTGLGAVRRLAPEFDIHSTPGRGTAVYAAISRDTRLPASEWLVGGVWHPAPKEEACGDAIAVRLMDEAVICLVADGLGHGPAAAVASRAACEALFDSTSETPEAILDLVNARLRPTRGAAVAVATIKRDSVTFAGVGNISAAIRGGERSQNLVSTNGIAGHHIRKTQTFQYDWPAGSSLVMHSDGLQSHWSADQEPGLLRRHPSIVAAVLARNHTRGRDDVSVLVLRRQEHV